MKWLLREARPRSLRPTSWSNSLASTPTGHALSASPLVRALESTKGPHQEYAEELAVGIREALPPEGAWFTPDSLAAAFWDALEGWGHIDVDGGSRGVPEEETEVANFAAAIIQAREGGRA